MADLRGCGVDAGAGSYARGLEPAHIDADEKPLTASAVRRILREEIEAARR